VKVNESGRMSQIQAYRSQAQAANAKQASGMRGKAKDDVKISEEAMKLLETQRANASDRSEKIERLKQEVQSGTYRVSTEKLAEKLWPFLK